VIALYLAPLVIVQPRSPSPADAAVHGRAPARERPGRTEYVAMTLIVAGVIAPGCARRRNSVTHTSSD